MNEKNIKEQKLVFITGAAKGIGRAAAQKFLDRGYKVAAADLCFLKETPKKDLHKFIMDVTDRTSVEDTVKKVEKDLGEIDILVSAAGVFETMAATDTEEAVWDNMYDVNVKGVFHVTQAVGQEMKKRKRGTVVIVSSNASKFPRKGMAAYASSKAAASMYAKCFGLEMAEYNIRCNIVSPGSTNTDMQRKIWDGSSTVPDSVLNGDLSNYRLGIPLGKIAEPEEIAEAVYFLASARSGHITMEELTVDGGATMGV